MKKDHKYDHKTPESKQDDKDHADRGNHPHQPKDPDQTSQKSSAKTDAAKPHRKRRWLFLFLKYSFILLAIAAAGTYLLLSIFLFFNGKNILIKACNKHFSSAVSVRSVHMAFPFGLVINGFESGDTSFKKAIIKMNPLAQIFRRNSFDSIYIDKLAVVVKDNQGKMSFSPFINDDNLQAPLDEEPGAGYLPKFGRLKYGEEIRFSSKRITLKDAIIIYVTVKDDREIALPLWETNLKIENYKYPELPMFTVDMTGYIWTSDWAELRASGWVDYKHRDMDVDINIDNINYSNLVRHLPPEWSPEKTGVEDGQLYFRSRLKSQSNDLLIDWAFVIQRLDLRDRRVALKTRIFKSAIDALGGEEGHAARYGTIRTRMDRPWFELKYSLDETETSIDVKLGENLRVLTSEVVDKIKLIAADGIRENLTRIKRMILFK